MHIILGLIQNNNKSSKINKDWPVFNVKGIGPNPGFWNRSIADIRRYLQKHGVTSIPAQVSSHIHYKVCDEIIHLFQNFNGATRDLQEWVSNFIPHFTGLAIKYP